MSGDEGGFVRCAYLAVVCGLAVSFAVLPVRADWGALTSEGDTATQVHPSSGAAARALSEFRRVRGVVRSLKLEIERFHQSPSVEDVRQHTFATEVESIMGDSPPDATEGIEKVRKMTQGAIEDLNLIQDAVGAGNSDWSEEFE